MIRTSVSNNFSLDYYNSRVMLFIIVVISSWFSPLISFSLSVLYLLTVKKEHLKISLIFFTLAIYSYFLIYFSRDFIDELSKDWAVYHHIYSEIKSGNKNAFYTFGGGTEIGWPILYSIIAKLEIKLDAIELAGINLIISVTLFFIWLKNVVIRNETLYENKELIFGLSVLFLAIGPLGYMQRQSLSIVFLLFAITGQNKGRIIFFSILSILFHVTALPLLLIYSFLFKIKISRLFFLFYFLLLIIFRFYFYDIVNYIVTLELPAAGLSKLTYYTLNENINTSISSFLLYVFLGSVLLFRWKSIDTKWKNVIAVSFFSYIALSGIPLLAERINFILFYLTGFFIFIVFSWGGKPRSIFYLRVFSILYLILFVSNKIYQSFGEFGHWYRYDIISHHILYYFFNIF